VNTGALPRGEGPSRTMDPAPQIEVVKIEHGRVPQAASLNPRLSPHRPVLLATVDVRWHPADPVAAVGHIEEELLAFSPSFARHQCRGLEAYHVFLGNGHVRRGRAVATGDDRFDGRLALAHLLEHATIDFQCTVTGERTCSGVTAAHRSTPDRFDLMIECRDGRIGRCCLTLAAHWLIEAARGLPPGAAERAVLRAAHLAHQREGQGLRPPVVARVLHLPAAEAERALAVLSDIGFLREAPYTVNLSGVPEYRITR
jgi:hypothetical protein